MMQRLADLARLPERQIFTTFSAQAANLAHAADLLEQLIHHHPDRSWVRADILVCEQQGDQLLNDAVQRVTESFVGPIELRDALDLARALNRVVDLIDEVAELIELYAVPAMRPESRDFARILKAACGELTVAIDLLPNQRDYSARTAAVVRFERDANGVFRTAIAELIRSTRSPIEVICWKDLFERLEQAVDASRGVAAKLDLIARTRS